MRDNNRIIWFVVLGLSDNFTVLEKKDSNIYKNHLKTESYIIGLELA